MFRKILFFSIPLVGLFEAVQAAPDTEKPQNIILMMCDDLGWGDTGFNGNKVIKTPNLDQMAADGAKLNHFYSIGPVCSPTRASFLTGRHYFRMGIWTANYGHLPKEEFTIARMLREKGYATGHFGKWHLGTLSTEISAKGKRRRPEVNFAPPWLRDYDASFVTESAVQTWDPGSGGRAVDNPYYENGSVATENLEGCDSRVLMDRAIPFIRDAATAEKPFVAVIWFHAPHEDLVAGPKYLKMYEGYGAAAHYYGSITAVDDQVGRLRGELDKLGLANNTALFFCSDNGPEGPTTPDQTTNKRRTAGVTGGFTGRKRSVNEGGVRVPAIALWPGHIQPGTAIDTPCSVLDYLPTVSAITGAEALPERILDGENIIPILEGKKSIHEKSIPFRYEQYACLVKGEFKLIITSPTDNSEDKLYDLAKDKTESNNLLKQYPEMAQQMRGEILSFLASARASHNGVEYGEDDYNPTDPWKDLRNQVPKKKKSSPEK